MHRRALLAALYVYEERHPDEGETVARFRDFVAANAGCFDRSLRAGHVTGSAWLVNPAGTEVLLTHHRKLGIWVQLGGHADGDPDIFRVALREAVEESGLAGIAAVDAGLINGIFDLDIHLIPERGSEIAHLHYDVRYALHATNDTEFRVSSESRALAWVPIDALAGRAAQSALTREESIRRMALKWQTTMRA